jgi:hypothetical protein
VAYGREPQALQLRIAFGLPAYVKVQACPKCGKLHDTVKLCPDKRKPRRPRAEHVSPLWLSMRPAYRRLSDEEVEVMKARMK